MEKEKNQPIAKITHTNADYIRLQSSGAVYSFQFQERVISLFSRYDVSVLLLTSSSTNISLAVKWDNETARQACLQLRQFAEVSIEKDIVCIQIPEAICSPKEVVGKKIIQLLHHIPTLMISLGSENCHATIAIRQSDSEKALQILRNDL